MMLSTFLSTSHKERHENAIIDGEDDEVKFLLMSFLNFV